MKKRDKQVKKISQALTEAFMPLVVVKDASMFTKIAEAIIECVEDPPPKASKKNGYGTAASRSIGHYCDLWRARFNSDKNPRILKKDANAIQRFVKELGEKDTFKLLGAYFSMPNSYYAKRSYPISMLERDFNEIWHFALSGKFTSNGQMRSYERSAGVASQLDRIERGEL